MRPVAKNLSREFATMSEDEKRRFAMEAEGGTDAAPSELDFEDPRDENEAEEQVQRRNSDTQR